MTKSGFKLKANLLGAALLASLALVGCQQTTTPPVDEGTAPAVSITAPVAGSVVAGDTLTASISVQHTASLTALKYQFAGGSEVSVLGKGSVGAAAVVNTTERNFTVTVPAALANGAAALKVTATDSKGRSNSTEVSVTVNRGDSASIGAGPQLNLDADGRVVLGQANGVRTLSQQINGSAGQYLYARGTIQLSATPVLRTAGQSVSRVEFWIAETPSSPAIDYIADDTAAPYEASYNTARVLSREGQLLYVVVRVTRNNGSNYTAATPLVVDNQGPESPDLSLSGATGAANSNFLTNVCKDTEFGSPDNNWARGTVRHRLSNTDLEDTPVSSPNRVPSGIEAVTYYYLATSKESSVPNPGAAGRAAYIRGNAAASAKVQFAQSTNDYRVDVNSVGTIADGTYIVYAVMNDQLGNETASNFGFRLGIDNTAPVAAGAVEDASPLPFIAADGYISDWFDYAAIAADAGVGFSYINYAGAVSFGNADDVMYTDSSAATSGYACGPTAAGRVIYPYGDIDSDSNYLADGPTNLVVRARDILGNTLAETVVDSAIIDNTDPEVDIVHPLPGETFAAGTDVDVETTTADSTSGIMTVKLFWNDFVADWQDPEWANARKAPLGKKSPLAGDDNLYYTERFRQASSDYGDVGPGFIAAPVQFAEGNNGTWTALYPRGFSLPFGLGEVENSPTEPMRLHAWAIDNAGNVRMLSRRVNVTEVGSLDDDDNLLPILGNFDVYKVGNETDYYPVTADGYSREHFQQEGRVDSGGGTSSSATDSHNVDLSTLTTDSGQEVVAVARAALNRWNGGYEEGESEDSFLGWMLDNDPSLEIDPNLYERRVYIEGWAEIDQDAGLVVGSYDADNEDQDVDVAPWFLYANTFTSSGVNRSQGNLLTDGAYRGISALGYVAYGTDDSVDPRAVGEYNLAYEDLGFYGSVSKISSDYTAGLAAGTTFYKSWLVQLYNQTEDVLVDLYAYGAGGGSNNPMADVAANFYGISDAITGFGDTNEADNSIGTAGNYSLFYSDTSFEEDGYAADNSTIGLDGSILSGRDVVAYFGGRYKTRSSDIPVLSGIGLWIDLDRDAAVDTAEKFGKYSFNVIP